MYLILIIGITALLLILALSFFVLTIKVFFSLKNGKDQFLITIMLGKIKLYKFDISRQFYKEIFYSKKEKQNSSQKNRLHYKPILDFLFRHTRFQSIYWKTEIGLLDAAVTGWLIGAIWIAKKVFLSWLFSHYSQPNKPPKVIVMPKFNEQKLNVEVECIFRITVGHIISIGLKVLLLRIKKREKNGE